MDFLGNVVNGAVDFAGDVANATKNIATETVTAIGDFPNTVKNLPQTFDNAAQGIATTATGIASSIVGNQQTVLGTATFDISAWMRALEGKRVKNPNGDIFLILDQKARHVANGDVYNGLFASWNDVEQLSQEQIESMPRGTSLTAVPPMISPSSGGVYVIDEGKRRHVANPDTMTKYGFDWSKIVGNHDNSYPEGEQIAC